MCSTENRDFIHTSYTKILCLILNGVLPLHKCLNSESGKTQIANVRKRGLQSTGLGLQLRLQLSQPGFPKYLPPINSMDTTQHQHQRSNADPNEHRT